ncbi:MAG: rhodanese-like domain-containing protein [Spirochaetota bacterium]
MRRFFVAAAMAVFVIAGVGGQGSDPGDLSQYAGAQALYELLTTAPNSVLLIDTRTPEEYEAGHIPGAVLIDYREIGDNPPTEDKDAPIILYCRSGNRAGRAERTLRRLGYTNVFNWGGIIDWPYEVVTGPEPGSFGDAE